MGLCLIAWSFDPMWIVYILGAALALGVVIFVHELGHFMVAKLCGVKCEKFYLGFDIYGLKLAKFRWGETEYGIGILPLGGYVKMLGQEDNPARLREEIERARMHAESGQADAAADAPSSDLPKNRPASDHRDAADDLSPADVAAAEQALFNPRSYLAKSVPKRMAIISAGVIMNVIFAFVAAPIAYKLGVEQLSARAGSVVPGHPAWQMGVEVGDRIVAIDGYKIEKFADLKRQISLGDNLAEGVEVKILRPGQDKPIERRIVPTLGGMMPTIGIGFPHTTTLNKDGPVANPGSAAWRAQPALQSGDQIVKIDDARISSYADICRYLGAHRDRPLKVTVRRAVEADDAAEPQTEEVEVVVPINSMRRLGLVMNMGEITAIQDDSPAAQAGLRVGDKIVNVAGKAVEDPMTLPDWLRKTKRPGETIELTVERQGAAAPLPVSVTLRRADRYEESSVPNAPVALPELGLTYDVLNRVAHVLDGSLAAKAGIKPGSVLKQATLLPPEEMDPAYEKFSKMRKLTLEFSEKEHNWPLLMHLVQQVFPNSRVQLLFEDDSEATLTPVDAPDWCNPDRGFRFEYDLFTQKAETWGDAVRLGAREAWDSLTMVVQFVRKLSSRQLSVRALGGPISIFQEAGNAASRGLAQWLIFVTVLSANLAVLNFLPIPLLDGGHMLFLAWEGIRGKPADERVQLVLTYFGLAFILGLMILVFGLDLGLISRQVPVK